MPISARKEILKESYRNLPKHRHSQRCFLSFLAMALMVSTAFGLDNNPTNQEAVLLWEKDFGEELVDVIFDEAEMTVEEARALGFKGLEQREATDTVVVQYPKGIIVPYPGETVHVHEPWHGKKEIKLYSREGNETKSIQIKNMERIIMSPKQSYFIVARMPNEFRPDVQGGVLYRIDGTEIWRKEEGPFPVAVSDEGYVISGYLPYESEPPGDFVFYNSVGGEIGRIKNPLEDFVTGWSGAKFTSDGRNAVIGFTHLGQKTVIILTTKEGKVLWEKEIKYCAWTPYEADISEGIGIVGVGVRQRPKYEVSAYLIDWEGNLKWMVPLNTKGNMVIRFSENGEKVIIAATAGYLFCIEVQTGRLLWEYREDWSPSGAPVFLVYDVPWFAELEVINNCIYVKGEYRDKGLNWYGSALFIFDADNGHLIKKTEYPEKQIYLQSQENELFVIDRTSRKVSYFEIQ